MKTAGLHQQRGENVRVWQSPYDERIELSTAELYSWSSSKHMHEEFQLSIHDAGIMSLTCRGTRQIVGNRCVALLSPGDVHAAQPEGGDGWRFRNVFIPTSIVNRVSDALELRVDGVLHLAQPIIDDDGLWATVDRLYHALSGSATRLAADALLLSALSRLFNRYAHCRPTQARSRPGRNLVHRCRSYIESNYSNDISLEALARISGLSPFHLIRSFKREFGLPPHAFQIQLRLNKARADLRAGVTPVAAAMAHGFYDQSHFHRHFQRSFGVSPGQYRKMVRHS